MGENSSDAFSDAGPVVVGAVPNNLIVGNGRFRKTLDRCLVGGRGVRAVVQMLVLVPSAGGDARNGDADAAVCWSTWCRCVQTGTT